jgi:hypothetical protein
MKGDMLFLYYYSLQIRKLTCSVYVYYYSMQVRKVTSSVYITTLWS